MNMLAIDTSTKDFSAAVMTDGKVIKRKNFKLKKLLSSSIVPSIDKILKDCGLSINDIDVFAVGLGPGSFTSLRVGLSTIKAFAFANNKNVIGIPSLDAIALNVKEDTADICVICDARRSMVYSCLYAIKDGKLCKKSEHVLTDIKTVLKNIKNKAVFIGEGISIYREEIDKSKKAAKYEIEKNWPPKAEKIAILALEKHKKKQFDNAGSLIPLYLYPDDCQVQKKAKK